MKHFILFATLAFCGISSTTALAKGTLSTKSTRSQQNTSTTSSTAAKEAAASIEGYWQIVEKTAPEAIALVYEKDGVHYIRMVALYDDAGKTITETITSPQEKAQGLSGNPYLCGLDFVWGLMPESNGNRFKGTVTDPDHGKSYTCEVWFDEHRNRLVVRGELLVFGQSQYWPSIKEEDVPEGARLDLEKIKLNLPPQS